MSTTGILWAVAAMAVATYIPRCAPLLIFKKRIQSRFIRSFLEYIPFAALGAMILPAILYSVPELWAAAAGTLVALVLGWFNKGIMITAVCAVAAAFLVGAAL